MLLIAEYVFLIISICTYRVTFKSSENCEVVKQLIREIRILNPEFQAGHIRGKSCSGMSVFV